MKNDQKYIRNKYSMTQDYDYNQIYDKNDDNSKMMKMIMRLITTDDKNDDSYKNDDK